MASLVLKKGADIHAKVINGETRLFVAAKYANPELAGLLIKAGADTNVKNREKLTPLAYLNLAMESISKEEKDPAQLSRLQQTIDLLKQRAPKG